MPAMMIFIQPDAATGRCLPLSQAQLSRRHLTELDELPPRWSQHNPSLVL